MIEKIATIDDVAAHAGVSIATVSRALHKPQMVSEATRQKVQSAIAATGYTVNVMARNLRLNRSGMILLLVPDIGNPFFSEILSGIEQGASKAGYSVLIGDTQNDPDREASYAAYLRSNQADALILLNGRLPAPLAISGMRAPSSAGSGDGVGSGISGTAAPLPGRATPPVVVACERIPGCHFPTVIIDNEQAAFDATRHLTDLGHRRIAHIAGPANNILTTDRMVGYRRALNSAGIDQPPPVVYGRDFTIETGIAAARALLADPANRPDAFFCASDGLAIGVIVAAKELGLRVPDDISVVGFDDIYLAGNYDPPLTTIRQPRRQLGEQAIALLLDHLDPGRNDPAPSGTGDGASPSTLAVTATGRDAGRDTDIADSPVIIPTELIIRQSTAPRRQ